MDSESGWETQGPVGGERVGYGTLEYMARRLTQSIGVPVAAAASVEDRGLGWLPVRNMADETADVWNCKGTTGNPSFTRSCIVKGCTWLHIRATAMLPVLTSVYRRNAPNFDSVPSPGFDPQACRGPDKLLGGESEG